MTTQLHSITDAPDYAVLFGHCADLVESAPNRKLMAAELLNAAIAISLCTLGSKALAAGLLKVAEALPAEEVKARNRLA